MNIQNGFNVRNTIVVSIMEDIAMMTYPRGIFKWTTSNRLGMNGSKDFDSVGKVILTNTNIELDVEKYDNYYKIALMKV